MGLTYCLLTYLYVGDSGFGVCGVQGQRPQGAPPGAAQVVEGEDPPLVPGEQGGVAGEAGDGRGRTGVLPLEGRARAPGVHHTQIRGRARHHRTAPIDDQDGQ